MEEGLEQRHTVTKNLSNNSGN